MGKGLPRSLARSEFNFNNDPDHIFVAPNGSDSGGEGTIVSPYATITKAFAQVTATRKTVIVLPGSYAEAAALVWPVIDDVRLIGIGGVTISAVGTTQVIGIAPGALTATFDARIEGVYIDHSNASQDGILIDNTDTTKKIILTLKNVGGDNDGGTGGDMIATVHADTDNAIRIYWSGDNGDGVEGNVNFTNANDGDRLYIDHCYLIGGVASAAVDVAFDIRLRSCVILHEGVTGGHATQTCLLMDCFTDNGSGTFAAADATDVATQTETVV